MAEARLGKQASQGQAKHRRQGPPGDEEKLIRLQQHLCPPSLRFDSSPRASRRPAGGQWAEVPYRAASVDWRAPAFNLRAGLVIFEALR